MNSSDFERSENQKYKAFVETQVESGAFCPFRREKQFDFLFPRIAADIEAGATRLLDLCCGYGRLAHFLNEAFPQLEVHGVDYFHPLIDEARQRFGQNPAVSFEVGDAFTVSEKHAKSFDLTVIYKTVSWLPYYESIVAEAIKVSRRKIYITSLFWDGDIDFITKIHPAALQRQAEHYSYLNTYSLPKFRDYCLRMGAREVLSEPMALDFDLPEPTDPNQLQTWTVATVGGRRLELTGPVVLNWKLVEIRL